MNMYCLANWDSCLAAAASFNDEYICLKQLENVISLIPPCALALTQEDWW